MIAFVVIVCRSDVPRSATIRLHIRLQNVFQCKWALHFSKAFYNCCNISMLLNIWWMQAFARVLYPVDVHTHTHQTNRPTTRPLAAYTQFAILCISMRLCLIVTLFQYFHGCAIVCIIAACGFRYWWESV